MIFVSKKLVQIGLSSLACNIEWCIQSDLSESSFNLLLGVDSVFFWRNKGVHAARFCRRWNVFLTQASLHKIYHTLAVRCLKRFWCTAGGRHDSLAIDIFQVFSIFNKRITTTFEFYVYLSHTFSESFLVYQPVNTCSKLTTETLKKGVKYVQR